MKLTRKTLQTVIDHLPCGVTLVDSELIVRALNNEFLRLLELPPGLAAHGAVPLETFIRYNAERGEYGPGDPEEKIRAAVERAHRMEPHVFELVRPNGSAVEVRGLPLPDGSFITIYTDITKHKRSERDLLRFRLAMDSSVDSIYLTDPATMKFVDVNAAACSRLGYTREQLLRMGPQDVLGRDRENIRREYDEVIAAGERGTNSESRFVRSDGSERWTEIHRRALRVNDEWLIVTIGRDITDRKRAEEALQRATELLAQLALHDPLTGLANRRKFAERFEYDKARAVRARMPLSLLMVDIDHFKAINDRHGHLAGDACLKALAALLTGSVRAVDLVARFGGEEFVVLLPEMSAEQSLMAAERMRSEVQTHPLDIGEGAPPEAVTVSVGAATLAGPALTLENLLARADEAVYRAKRAGRNQVCA
ncbi:MAG TPA: diguanylate cyclase [Burkholderiales bacterium]|nr:diguanylate cyclase [Burkholderiales bacterium]